MKQKKETSAFTLDREVADYIKTEAEKQDRSKSSFVNKVMKDKIKEEEARAGQ